MGIWVGIIYKHGHSPVWIGINLRIPVARLKVSWTHIQCIVQAVI